MTREFCDRLVNAHDREFFHLQIRLALESMGLDVLTLDDVVFGDFSRNRGEDLEYNECQPSFVKNLLKVKRLSAFKVAHHSSPKRKRLRSKISFYIRSHQGAPQEFFFPRILLLFFSGSLHFYRFGHSRTCAAVLETV